MNPFVPPLNIEELKQQFPEYGDMDFLAQGGQGIVIRSHLLESPLELLAIKIYFPGSHTERTKREIQSLAKLTSINIASLKFAGVLTIRGESCPYVVTEFIPGLSLQDRLTAGPMTESEVMQVGRGVANAIMAMWKLRVVHRDIKPANIMRRPDGECVLIDLGVARHLAFSPLTTIGKTWGTDGYMSPEHARALRQLSCKSDVFALGVTLQECLLSRHPTNGHQHSLLFGGVRTFTLLPSASQYLAETIDAMLEYRPEKRPSPADLVDKFSLVSQ